ncbi:hypothetical protein DF185_10395 [Marinifilum breve]|uniref:Uncharacterized protein n=1 Tax=Marinifilum breve TaxID=2184082 RepID=A0A2V3ZWL5_9BACT|nr:hypothetical protein [Marinifilum breve]PXY01055.1 hypothetical protein DF185_10395 [Marinifilum breve]
MKTKKYNISLLIFVLLCCNGFCQEKLIRIGPSYSNTKITLEPIHIYDGIPMNTKIFEALVNLNTIDSIVVLKDSIYNKLGEAKHYGIIELYTKDSINTGLKYILEKSNHWMYKHPLSALKINNSKTKWNRRIIRKLITLRPEEIIDINTVEPNSTRGQENGLMILKILNY